MSLSTRLKEWFVRLRGRPLDQLLAVEFDDEEVRVRVIASLEPAWNQTFRWSEVSRVCFQDEGLWSSDVIYVELGGGVGLAAVPTEARGGPEFFGELVERELFPESVWSRALGDTSGGTHCWPPKEPT